MKKCNNLKTSAFIPSPDTCSLILLYFTSVYSITPTLSMLLFLFFIINSLLNKLYTYIYIYIYIYVFFSLPHIQCSIWQSFSSAWETSFSVSEGLLETKSLRLSLMRISLFHLHFLKINKFIYLFIFGCVGYLLLRAGFLQLQRAGDTLCCSAWTYWGGFSRRRAWAQQLWLAGSRAQAQQCGARA